MNCPTCKQKPVRYSKFDERSGLFTVCHCVNGHEWPFTFVTLSGNYAGLVIGQKVGRA